MHLARYTPLVSTTASHRSRSDRRLLSREFIYHQAGLDSVGEAFIQHEDKYYRPISILPTISKIIERSAHVQLCFYLEENKLLSQSQFGFRQKRSTSTALITFTDQILESMDKGYVTGAVFLDLRKAFDTVDLLINKLKGLEWQEKVWHGSAHISLAKLSKRCVKMNCLPQLKSLWGYHRVVFLVCCYS